ncbi:MAG TPA: hypothetical protein DCS67_04335 [Clostridiales bacterium UBA8960]|nr:hypothetical protein [Clostridiales bacterium UBA8960]
MPQTRRLIDVKIYLDTEEKLRRHWKIKRDVMTRGYSTEKIIKQIEMREEDAQKYIHPQMHYSDLVIRFFSDDAYTEGDMSYNPKLMLKILLKLDVEVEGIIEAFETLGHDIEHYYDSDMKFQHIILKDPVSVFELKKVSEQFIENIDEIVNGHEIEWLEGYHGFIQLMTLALISHNLKKGDENEL